VEDQPAPDLAVPTMRCAQAVSSRLPAVWNLQGPGGHTRLTVPMTRIALDAMGGDHAPQQTILGAIDAAARGVDVVLVGDRQLLSAALEAQGVDLPIVHAPQAIAMGEDPGSAIRERRQASICVAARLIVEGEVGGMVSAGSTGATLAAAAIIVGRVAGVSRPAIATIFPMGSPTVVLDVGANLEARPEHLAQFAVMGSVMARVYLGLQNPAVGLLNIGEEAGKGRALEREAHCLLASAPVQFVGNVEGRDLGRGKADVFVTDGFTGNVLLKGAEGTARAVARLILQCLTEDADQAVQEAAGVVLPRLLELRERFDPEVYGGAHLLGTRGTVVIAHGSSSRVAVANALVMASEGAARGMVEQMERGMDHG
jgi:glycerol-3-phosphate acyltransferase PlsX